MEVSPFQQARVLAEALPYMQRYDEAIVVVKYGGSAMGRGADRRAILPATSCCWSRRRSIRWWSTAAARRSRRCSSGSASRSSQFEAGLRITDKATLESVEMVLAGSINKQMVGYINEAGGRAVGLCGKDGNMVVAKKLTRTVVDPGSEIEKVIDLGFVGEPERVDTSVLDQILGRELIPVLAPVCAAADGGTYNVNADTFAGAIAGALKAKRFLLLTDVPGVLDESKTLIKELSVDDARRLIADGTISGGMIAKVETCIDALERGVEGVVVARRQGVARGAARTVHRARRRHAHPITDKYKCDGRREAGHAASCPRGGSWPRCHCGDLVCPVGYACQIRLRRRRRCADAGADPRRHRAWHGMHIYLRLDPPKPSTPRVRMIALGLGVLLAAAVVYGLFKAIELITVPVAVLTYFAYPLLTGIGGFMFRIERLSWQGALAALVAFLGLALMIGACPQHLPVLGIMFALGAAVSRAVLFWSAARNCRRPIHA